MLLVGGGEPDEGGRGSRPLAGLEVLAAEVGMEMAAEILACCNCPCPCVAEL